MANLRIFDTEASFVMDEKKMAQLQDREYHSGFLYREDLQGKNLMTIVNGNCFDTRESPQIIKKPMKLARLVIEDFIYPLWKNLHFLRDENIEQSHQSMITTTRFLASLKLTKFFLYDPSLAKKNFIISNAAGWNKEATIPSIFFAISGLIE